MKVSVVVPCFNEKSTVASVVEKLCAFVGNDFEVIVVDDGSTDGTREILEGLAVSHEIRLVLHDRNLGKGAAIRSAIEKAFADVVLIFDADNEYDVHDCIRLIESIKDGADVVFGSRLLEGGGAMRWMYRVYNGLYAWVVSLVTGGHITDPGTALKAFRAELLCDLNLEQNGFGVETELAVKLITKPGVRFLEIPVSYSPRSIREGKKIRWWNGFQMFSSIFRYTPTRAPL